MENKETNAISNNEIPMEHLAVLNLIREAKDKCITRKKLIQKLRKESDYYRRLDKIINELITVYGCAIGSSSSPNNKGYFLIETKEDYNLAVKTLETRIKSSSNRLNSIINNSNFNGGYSNECKKV